MKECEIQEGSEANSRRPRGLLEGRGRAVLAGASRAG